MNNRPLSKTLNLSSEFNSPAVWRWIIIVIVLSFSALLAVRTSEYYLAGIVGVAGLVILIRYPRLGLLALLISSMVVPIAIGTSSQTPITPTIILIPALLGLWLLNMMVRKHRVQLVPSRTNLPLLALGLSATISLAAAGLPWNLFAGTAPIVTQIGGWAIFVFAAGVFFLVGNQVHDERWLKIFVVCFLVIAGIYMIGRLSVPGFNQISLMMSRLGSDGSMMWVWMVAIAMGQLLFNQKLNRIVQLALLGVVGMTLYVGWFLTRTWTSGYLPPLVVVGTILWLRSWRLGLLAALVGGVIFLLMGPSNLINSLLTLKDWSISTRDIARQILLEDIFPMSPIIGLGPANYYYYTPLFPILGYYSKFNSHNNYVDILIQTGLVGLVCFFWFVWEYGWLGWRLRKQFQQNDFAQGYVNACLGGLAGTLVACWLADWLLPFVYNIGLNGFRASVQAWFLMGGLVTLEQIARRSNSVTGETAHE